MIAPPPPPNASPVAAASSRSTASPAIARRTTCAALLFFIALGTPSPAEAQVFFAGQAQVDVAQFDSWIFNQYGTAERARESLEARIGIKIRRVEQSLNLREDQKQVLRLAGMGDINRFFNRVNHARAKFREMTMEDRNNLNDAYQLAAPLQQELTAGLFENGSLFAKVLRGTLDAQQRELLEQGDRERRQEQLENHVKSYVNQLETQIPLIASQRERLVALITEQARRADPQSQYFFYVLNYHVSQLPEEEVERVLDAGQLRVFRKVQAQHAGMAPFLRQQGVLDDLDE